MTAYKKTSIVFVFLDRVSENGNSIFLFQRENLKQAIFIPRTFGTAMASLCSFLRLPLPFNLKFLFQNNYFYIIPVSNSHVYIAVELVSCMGIAVYSISSVMILGHRYFMSEGDSPKMLKEGL